MNKCEICGKELTETYALEWRLCEECRKEKSEIEQQKYTSGVQKPAVYKYLLICLINLLVCAVLALSDVPYGSDGYADSYFAFIRPWVLIINYAIHTPLMCLHLNLYSKRSKKMILSTLTHIAISVWLFPTSMFFWTCI